MGDRTYYPRNTRGLKAFSLIFVVLASVSLLLVHDSSYDPPVSFILLYLASSVGIVVAVILVPLLPSTHFTAGFCGSIYALYAAVIAMMVFFSGGLSSEMHVMFFPLLLASALHGSWRLVLAVLAAVLFCYALAMLPVLLESGMGGETSSVYYRIGALGLTGLFMAYASRSVAGPGETDRGVPEDGSPALIERVDGEISSRPDVPVAVILVDPGEVGDLGLLLDRVEARIGEPVLLEDNLFGVVVGGVEDAGAESAARRALAAAGSVGAGETRAGAAVYPRDARSAEDLLAAAGRALEASFEVEGPSAIVIAGRSTPEDRRRAARQ